MRKSDLCSETHGIQNLMANLNKLENSLAKVENPDQLQTVMLDFITFLCG